MLVNELVDCWKSINLQGHFTERLSDGKGLLMDKEIACLRAQFGPLFHDHCFGFDQLLAENWINV